jgi:hypothetical protein
MKQVRILQIPTPKDDTNREIFLKKFSSLSTLKRMGMKFNPNIYTEVYCGEMDVEDAEDVYMKLQGRKPKGYKGHSLSISDLVQMDGKTYYCDSFDFVDVTHKMGKTQANVG